MQNYFEAKRDFHFNEVLAKQRSLFKIRTLLTQKFPRNLTDDIR